MYTTFDTYYSSWMDWNLFQSIQDNRQSSKKNNKYQMLHTYGCTF